MRPYFLFLASPIIFLFCFFNSVSSANETDNDKAVLLQFKKLVTTDPFGALSSWNNTTPVCQWYGITCDGQQQRVTILQLQSLQLKGSIPPHIGNLSFLQTLDLNNNSFSHGIPQEIVKLKKLQVLDLRNNSIGGRILSNLSACTSLVSLLLSRNNLMGEIPLEIGQLANLESLALYHNLLTGDIPASLGNLSALSRTNLGYNRFSGSIPSTFGKLKNLIFLSLSVSGLTGTIHPSIFNLSNLQVFDIGVNQFEGKIPQDIGLTLPNIQNFYIDNNNFTGDFPASISNATNLAGFQIATNGFTGQVPSLEKLTQLTRFAIYENFLGSGGKMNDLNFLCSLTNATNLNFLFMASNNFGGQLPECMSRLTSLQVLSIEINLISGIIPPWIGNLINLDTLSMSYNPISGNIPSSIGKLENLQRLVMSNLNLTGNIPSSLGNLSMLIYIQLDGNNLQGNIPSNLSNCVNLFWFDVSQNNLSGGIPSSLISLPSLNYLDLSNNKLTGNLSFEAGNHNLGQLDVSRNMLSGNIPSSLGGFTSLEILDMEGNFFEGRIPSSLSSLKGIRFLDLSSNNLTGEIPDFLASFDLQYLNLSNNNFDGNVPIKGIFANSSAISVGGNSKLCGGIPEIKLARCKSKEEKKKRLTNLKKLIISIALALLGVILVSSIFLFFLRKKKRKQSASTDSENSPLKVSYQNLLKATEGFSSANLIGVGSFGSVYKGCLDQDTIIAVKVFNLLRKGGPKSFIAECEALRNIRHRNLVKVLTACSGIDNRGNDFKALVYELMVNGSLHDWLHPPANENADAAPKSLNLVQKLNIAVDIASALEYLHRSCETPVAHCDLKPSNVLLDDNMIAHVSDFGLAKFLSDDIQNRSLDQASSFGIRGTVGYAPPEYGMGNEASTYGDVYSYGILLLEMFTGKRPTDEMFKEGLNLHRYVNAALPERLAEIIDPIILPEIENANQETIISVLKVGMACSVETQSGRMNISDAVAELCSIRNKFVKGSQTSGHRSTS